MMVPPLTPDERRDRLVFYPVALVGGLFCLTVLMTIAAVFSDPRSPVASWINRNAVPLLLGETALLVVVSLVAMGLDRRRTLQRLRHETSKNPGADLAPSAGEEPPHVG